MITDFNWQGLLEAASQVVTTWGLRVVGAIVLFVVGLVICKTVSGMVRRALERAKVDPTLAPFFAKMTYYLCLAFVVIAVLNLFGVETTSLAAVLGAAGLAVGLAVQGTLSNFASGVMLLVFRPFKVGDFVEAGGVAGSVVEIGVFATTFNTGDNVRIVTPNSSVYGQTIKVYTANPTRRNDMVIGISYDDDIGKAIDVIKGILDADPRVLKDPEPVVAVSELGDSSVNLVVRPWCTKEDYWGLRFDFLRSCKEKLEAAGCSIPYPQTDVHLIKADAA